MKKILGLTIAAILVIAMVAAGTFAYFQDTATSSNNNITAGTLDLKLNNGDGNYNIIAALDNKKPGDQDLTGNHATLSNAGSLTGKLSIAFGSVANIESAAGTQFTGDTLNDASGIATDGSATTLENSTATWAVNAYAGYTVTINSEVAVRTIASNTATTLTFTAPGVAVVNTDTYSIHVGELGAQVQIAPWIDVGGTAGVFDSGIDIALTPTGPSTAALVWNTMDSFSGVSFTDVITAFAHNDTADFYLPWKFVDLSTLDNSAQGDSFSVGITFTLDQ